MDETTAASFTIRFAASDADHDGVSLSLYYDTDTNPNNGKTLIASNVSATGGQDAWSTTAVTPGVYYIYAEASDGRNVVGSYSTGPVKVSTYTPPSDPVMNLDSPANPATVGPVFQVSGWAFDRAASSGTGVDYVHVYAYPNPGSGQAPIFLGAAAYGQARGDVGRRWIVALHRHRLFTPGQWSRARSVLPRRLRHSVVSATTSCELPASPSSGR